MLLIRTSFAGFAVAIDNDATVEDLAGASLPPTLRRSALGCQSARPPTRCDCQRPRVASPTVGQQKGRQAACTMLP